MRRHRFTVSGAVCALAALVAVLAGAPGTTTAEAQSLPTLEGEFLVAEAIGPDARPGDTFTTSGSCSPTGPSSYSFEAAGLAGGPYIGTFTESGTFTLGPDVGTNNRGVLEFESAFRIEAEGGVTITGTKRLLKSDSGVCVENADNPRTVNFAARVEYEAAITGPDGTYSVQGEAVVRATDAAPGMSFPGGLAQFSETFVTSTPISLPPSSVEVSPPAATNPVGTEHCVTATVRDALRQPYAGVTVRFTASGANSATGSAETDGAGQARFCYTGTAVGEDAIQAHADTDGDGSVDAGEPVGAATKTWAPARPQPATVTLDPPAATNPVGKEHCVTATVRDASGAPLPGVTVRFAVSGVSSASGAAVTGADGTAVFCYTGPATPGTDTIRAYADSDDDGTEDAGEPHAVATKVFVDESREPATVTVHPAAATNPVGTEHCVTATVRDAGGEPVENVSVRFTVTGAAGASGEATTDADGGARFCYAGPAFPGEDAIRAVADSDGDGTEDPGEPSGAATKTWVLPESTAGCSVTFGGHIVPAGGDKATFGGSALVRPAELKGAPVYVDHGRGLNVKSVRILAVVCSGTTATVYGVADVDGAEQLYRLTVTDVAEPGAGRDTYGIQLSNGYASGEQPLSGGNVQVRL